MPVSVTGPDNSEYEFPDGTTKDQAIAYFKAKGIGAPKQSVMVPPSIRDPRKDQSVNYAFSPMSALSKDEVQQTAAPGTFMERTGAKIKSNIEQPIRAILAATGSKITPTPQEKSLEDTKGKDLGVYGISPENPAWKNAVSAATVGPKMLYEMGKSWFQDPANAAGDIVTGIIAHNVAPAPEKIATAEDQAVAGRSPAGRPLTPEQQAKYTADIDAANAEYRAKTADYHDKMSRLFDESKREAQSAQEEFRAKSEEVRQKNAAKLAKSQQDFEDEVSSEAKSHAEWQAKMDAVEESKKQAAAVDAQAQALNQERQGLISKVRQGAQAVYSQVRTNLDNQWDAVRAKVGESSQTPVAPIANTINQAINEELKGHPANLQVFKDMMKEAGVGTVDDANQFKYGPAASDMTDWKTLRIQSNIIGRRLAEGGLTPNVYRALKMVRNAVEDAAEDLADSKGAGKDYRAVKAAESDFRNDFENLGNISLGEGQPIARLVRAPSDSFAADHITGKAGDILVNNLRKWDPSGQLADAADRARAIRGELKALPKVKVLKEPPPFEGRIIVGQPPDLAELPKAPGIPEKNPPKAPEIKTVKRPTPKAVEAKAGPIARTVGRLAGKLVGGAGGHYIGHPLLGYGLGGELGQQAADRLAASTTSDTVAVPKKFRSLRVRGESGAAALAARQGEIDRKAIDDTHEDIQKFIDSLPK